MVAQQQGHIVDALRGGQRGGGGGGVRREAVSRHPAGKAHGQGDAAHDGGVGKVIAQATEELLDDHDGDEGAHNGHPPGQRGRQVEGQEHTGDHRREVADGHLAAHQLAVQVLKDHTGRHSHRGQDQGVDPEDDDGGDQRGHQSDADPLHDLLGAVRAGNMGRGGYDQLVVHHFLPPFFIMIFARAVSYTHLDVYKRQPC